MNTNLQIKTISRLSSLNSQDSLLKENRKANSFSTPLITDSKSKREISVKTNKSIKQSELTYPLPKRYNNTPRIQVSVEFAAKQLFQILLVDIKRRNAQLNGELELVPGAILI